MREKSTQTLMSAADAPTEEALLSENFADDGDIGRRRGGAYGVARLGGRSTKRVCAGVRRCSKRLVGACVFAHDGNRRGFAWGRTAHEGLSFATGVELGRLIGAGVLAYDGDAAGLACFPGARLYGWRLVCTMGAVLLRGAPMLSSRASLSDMQTTNSLRI